MTNKVIEYKDIKLNYGKHTVLSKINFDLNRGEIAFITGKIGTGKTTFLKSIYAQIKPIGRKAQVLNYNLKKTSIWTIHRLRRQIGYIFQDFYFLNDKTVKENLQFVLNAIGISDIKIVNNKIENILKSLSLYDQKDKYPYELSGGQKQNLAIARAIITEPKIILADEPTNNLDKETANNILEKIYKLKDKNTAIIIVTHEPPSITTFEYSLWKTENGTLIKIK